jgi:hypothetical protein
VLKVLSSAIASGSSDPVLCGRHTRPGRRAGLPDAITRARYLTSTEMWMCTERHLWCALCRGFKGRDDCVVIRRPGSAGMCRARRAQSTATGG